MRFLSFSVFNCHSKRILTKLLSEDVGISLGLAFATALGDRKDITRFGSAYAPLDESLARAVVDLSRFGTALLWLVLQHAAIRVRSLPHVRLCRLHTPLTALQTVC